MNAHRCDPDAALAALIAAGADAEAHPAVGGSLLVRGGGAPHKLPGFAEGHWTVQDAAATLIGTLAAPAAGDRVALELCAAPGGKTTHTASLLQPSGGVVVAEIDGVAKEGYKHGGTAATALLLNAAEVCSARRLRRR